MSPCFSVPWSGEVAMPSDSVTLSGPISVWKISAFTASRIRSAITCAPLASVSGMTMANSSPP